MHYNLVFEGGGAKGLVFVGAMQEVEARGHTYGRVLGTSAGAITAALLAAGYDSAEMLQATNEKMADGSPRFSSFMDIAERFADEVIQDSLSLAILHQVDIPFIGDRIEAHIDRVIFDLMMALQPYRQVFSFIERGGLYAGDKFVEWLTEKLNAGGRNLGNATLAEFQAKTSVDLTVVGSDTTGGKILILNHRTAPDCPVVQAVRMSMSIPFLWQEVTWNGSWGLYRGEDITGHAIVDGGVLSNFPMELLISRDDEVTEMMGPHDGAFALGFLIDESLPVPDSEVPEVPGEPEKDRSKLKDIDLQQLNTVQRISRLINTMTMARDKQVIDTYADGVCRLPAEGYGTTEFDMSDARMEALIEAGRAAAITFFDGLGE